MATPDYITVTIAAEETACDPWLIRAAIRLGDLPAVRFGDGKRAPYYIDRSEAHQWAQRLKDRTSPEQG